LNEMSGGYIYNPLESRNELSQVSAVFKSVQGYEWYTQWSSNVWMDTVRTAGNHALGWLFDKLAIARRIEQSTLFSVNLAIPESVEDERQNGVLNMSIYFQSTNSVLGAMMRNTSLAHKLRVPLNLTIVENSPLGTFVATPLNYAGDCSEAHIRFLLLDSNYIAYSSFEISLLDAMKVQTHTQKQTERSQSSFRRMYDSGCVYSPRTLGEDSEPFFYQMVFDKMSFVGM